MPLTETLPFGDSPLLSGGLLFLRSQRILSEAVISAFSFYDRALINHRHNTFTAPGEIVLEVSACKILFQGDS